MRIVNPNLTLTTKFPCVAEKLKRFLDKEEYVMAESTARIKNKKGENNEQKSRIRRPVINLPKGD